MVKDLNGNLRKSVDGWKKSYKFTWDSNTFSSTLQIWQLQRLLREEYPIQMYPLGIGNSLITSTTGALATVDGELQLTPSSQPESMQPHHWSGFWIGLFNSLDNRYYIRDNTSTYFILEDKFGCGLADDTYDIVIDYILVQSVPNTQTFSQVGFTEFGQGGQLEEFESDTSYKFEYSDIEITLEEAENPTDL
jgi:hypothetical protein